MIRTEKINKEFQTKAETVHVLTDITVEIDSGFNVLCGRSGSGKTTLMNILGGLDMPTSGRVFLQEEVLTEKSEQDLARFRRKKIAFVFQSVALLGQMTAGENVAFALRLAEKPVDKERVTELLTLVGLESKVGERPENLSGGEQQRVAVARALIHEPQFLFADEPTAQLDSVSARRIVEIFQRVAREREICILMTTHDGQMQKLADRVFTMQNGKVLL